MIIGIDVSSYQGKPDWKKIKASGISFAFLRCHQRYGIDASFEHNYSGAVANGISVGVYKYSYALNTDEAVKEALAVLDVLKGKELQLPVYYDLEDDSQVTMSKEKIEEIANAFADTITANGYRVGIYVNKWWYDNKLSDSLKKSFPLWVAAIPSTDTGEIKESLRPSCADVWQYSWRGRVDGIAGEADMDVINGEAVWEGSENVVTANTILEIMRGWIGLSRDAGTHKVIIDTYNAHTPLARNYKVKYTDAYCDTTVSAAFIKAGNVDIIGGTECGVEEHVKLFQKAGIWIEDGTITPVPGDIIVFNWDTSVQPNDGYSDHIGIVESVSNRQIITIEGNINGGMVARRSIDLGWGYIRGFARPRYGTMSNNKATATFTSDEKKVLTREKVTAKKCTVMVPYIKKGNTGAMVAILQKALNVLVNAGLDVDGEFGTATDKALKNYQKYHNISASGTCGATTFKKIMEEVSAITFVS